MGNVAVGDDPSGKSHMYVLQLTGNQNTLISQYPLVGTVIKLLAFCLFCKHQNNRLVLKNFPVVDGEKRMKVEAHMDIARTGAVALQSTDGWAQVGRLDVRILGRQGRSWCQSRKEKQ